MTIQTSDKSVCRGLAALLPAYGVRDVVVSPGTRNAPLIMALSRCGVLRLHHCVDERAAAFRALGIGVATGAPVALCCTSGTAMLNYAPALAEAYYSRVPLIAVTADRPEQWIDQRDSQTIRQAGALDAVVRRSVHISDTMADSYANRLINDAMQSAVGHIPGPVHINVALDAPLTGCAEMEDNSGSFHKIDILRPSADSVSVDSLLSGLISPSDRVLVLVGGLLPAEADALRPAMKALVESGVAVVAEVQASLADSRTLSAGVLESALADTRADAIPTPDTVVTLGGALVSAHIKAWLRALPKTKHITIGYDDNIADTFGHAAARVECAASPALQSMARLMRGSCYGGSLKLSAGGDMPELARVVGQAAVSAHAALHIGNGLSIRHLQSADTGNCHVWCNRGVSGIDGCSSTAAGAAVASPDTPLLLVTGDMGCFYDISAITGGNIPDNITFAVVDNGGGDIFRRIRATHGLPECEPYLAAMPSLPLAQLAQAYGFGYRRVNINELTAGVITAALLSGHKNILHIISPSL